LVMAASYGTHQVLILPMLFEQLFHIAWSNETKSIKPPCYTYISYTVLYNSLWPLFLSRHWSCRLIFFKMMMKYQSHIKIVKKYQTHKRKRERERERKDNNKRKVRAHASLTLLTRGRIYSTTSRTVVI
jgi:hypothetical protein